MKQEFITRKISRFMTTTRRLNTRIAQVLNEIAEEVNPEGGMITKYDVPNRLLPFRRLSVIALINWK